MAAPKKTWLVVTIGGILTTIVLIFGIGGSPETVEVEGTAVPIADFELTQEAGPVLTAQPTPDPLMYGFCFIETQGDGRFSKDTIVSMKSADGANWGPGETGTPGPNGSKTLVFTKSITQTQVDTFVAGKWRVTRDGDGIPTGIEVIP